VHLSDLAASKETRDALRKRQYREIVVYDQSTVELDKLAPGHPLFLALSSLVEENREPAVLIGTFHNIIQHIILFWNQALKEKFKLATFTKVVAFYSNL
jgi:hypothetical protein